MRTDSTAHHSHRRRAIRGLTVLAGAAGLVLAALPAGIASASDGPDTLTVHQGQSIQAAVDKADSGDIIKLDAGTWTEGVCVWKKGLTIVGAGADRTTIQWPAWERISDLVKQTDPLLQAGKPCWEAYQASGGETIPNNLADDVSGLFFYYPDSPVTVANLSTKNHPAAGITAWGANGFNVYDTKGYAHEKYGVVASASHHVNIKGNVEQGYTRPAPVYSGTSGISVGDSDNASASVEGNKVFGYNLGVFIRESRGGEVEGNIVGGNCVGVLVFDDSATEVPDVSGHVLAGDWKITYNVSYANNRYCIAGRNGSQHVSGVGMAVVNTDHITVAGNLIKDNHPVVPKGQPPVDFPPGGLVLLSFTPLPDPNNIVNPGPVEYTTVVGNRLYNNQPVDIWLTRPIPNTPLTAPGAGNVFKYNSCATSDPAGLCNSSGR